VHIRGSPRIHPGSSIVVAASLPEGVGWYAALQSARSVVEIFGGLQDIFIFFVDPAFLTFLSLFFLFLFHLGLLVLSHRQLYRVVASLI
jgi:hypothetical protein